VVEGVWWAQAGVRGPHWGFVYIGFALVCAFARPLASLGTWLVFAGLAAALHTGGRRVELQDLLALVLLVGACGLCSWLSVRAQIEPTASCRGRPRATTRAPIPRAESTR
jgi:hypothetical protein